MRAHSCFPQESCYNAALNTTQAEQEAETTTDVNLVGHILGGYHIIDEIGRGSAATAYRAYQPSLDRYVAIKVFSPAVSGDAGVVERVVQAARAAARLHHPNLLTIQDVGQEDEQCFVVMEYLAVDTLGEKIEQEGPLPLPRVTQIVEQLAAALDHIHQHGLVHGGVKPDNIYVGADDHVTLADLGLNVVLARVGCGIDTSYMAPEQVQGDSVDPRADVYSLGAVAYEMLAGQGYGADQPGGDAPPAGEPPTPVFRPRRALPRSVEAVLARALAVLPGERWTSGAALAGALRQVTAAEEGKLRLQPLSLRAEPIHKEPAAPAVAVPPPQKGRRRLPRLPWPFLVLAAVLILALAGGLLALSLGQRDRRTPDATATSPPGAPAVPAAATASPSPTATALPAETATPTATATLTATPTPSPSPLSRATDTATPSPTPTATSSPTPTRTRPAATPLGAAPTATAPLPTPGRLAAPALTTPDVGLQVKNQVTFAWDWPGTLAGDQYFDVYLRRTRDKEAPYRGVSVPVKQRWVTADLKILIEDPAWNSWAEGPAEHGSEFWWSVAVIRWNGRPEGRHFILVESRLRPLKFTGFLGPTAVPCNCEDYLCGHCRCGQDCCQRCCRKCDWR